MFTRRRKSTKRFLVFYDKRVEDFKEKDSIQNARGKLTKRLDFAENSNFIRGYIGQSEANNQRILDNGARYGEVIRSDIG